VVFVSVATPVVTKFEFKDALPLQLIPPEISAFPPTHRLFAIPVPPETINDPEVTLELSVVPVIAPKTLELVPPTNVFLLTPNPPETTRAALDTFVASVVFMIAPIPAMFTLPFETMPPEKVDSPVTLEFPPTYMLLATPIPPAKTEEARFTDVASVVF
jgi:hypothetical protein